MVEFASLAGTLSIADLPLEIAEAAPEPDAEPAWLRPRVALELVHYTPEMLELVPREIAERHCLLPVYLRKERPRRKIPGVLFLAMANPADADAIEECSFCSGLTVKPLMAERWALQDAIPIVYAGGSPVWVRANAPSSTSTPAPPSVGAPPPPPSKAPSSVASPLPATTTLPQAPAKPAKPAAPAASPPAEPAAPGASQPVSAAPGASLPPISAAPGTSIPPVSTARSAETTVEVSEASLDELGDLGDLGDLDAAMHEPAGDDGPADTIRDPDEPKYGFDRDEKGESPDGLRGEKKGETKGETKGEKPDGSPGERPNGRRSERPEGHTSERPGESRGFVLLVVSASAALAEFCREAAEPLGGRVEICDVVDAPLLALAERPRFLIVAEEIYPFDRRAFNLLALEVGAPLVVWSLDMSPEDLQALLFAAGKKRQTAPGN